MQPDPSGGRPPKCPRREILNANFYVAKTGCQWRYLPKNLPPWKAVYMQFLRWLDNGKVEQIYDVLHRKLRVTVGKNETPSVGIIDSQSIKTTEKRGSQGLMGVKKLYVSEELEADLQQDWVKLEIVKKKANPTAEEKKKRGFAIGPKRWIVERSFVWLGKFRRFSKNYELILTSSKALILMAFGKLLL